MRTTGCLLVLLLASTAAAQGGAELPQAPPPPPPPAYADPTQPAPAAEPIPPGAPLAPTAPAACVPTCRAGFTCVQGQCVSACNPPCMQGERCTASGECIVPATEAPLYSEPDAPISAPDTGAERHDGFMLRMALAFGGTSTTESVSSALFDTTELEYSGFGVSFSLDLGASPIDDMVIHARMASFVNPSPTITQDGEDLGEVEDLTLSASLFGVGVTYYFMPINVYVTLVLGPSWLTVQDRDTDRGQATDAGLGLGFDVGKEWWVSDNWGLGVAGRFWLTTLEHDSDAGVPVDYTFLGFGVAFSATYH